MSEIDPAQAARTNRTLWATILASQAVYAAILIGGFARLAESPPDLPMLPPAFGLVAVAAAVGAHLSWRRARGGGRAAHEPAPDLAATFSAFLIAWVLDEAIAILGLVLGLLGMPPGTWAPFTAGAFVLTWAHRPS